MGPSTGSRAGGSGRELEVNNATAVFELSSPASNIEIKLGEYGGNVNLRVNGMLANEPDFMAITSLGGATVTHSVTAVPGGYMDVMTISGSISSIGIGGQELWIDDVCFTP